MAPATVAIVPITLAWVRILLNLTFSSLGREKKTTVYIGRRSVKLVFDAFLCCVLIFLEKHMQLHSLKSGALRLSYLRMQAIINVRAGRILVMAAAKVAVVYFIPRKYKFWSITGLPIEQDIRYV